MGIATLAFASGMSLLLSPPYGFGLIGGDFMPDFNRGEYQVAFKSTPGATLRETAQRTREMVRRLKSLPDVEYTYTTIGEAGSQYRPVTEGTTYVKLKESTRRKRFSTVLADARRVIEEVPGMTYGLFEAGPFGQKP